MSWSSPKASSRAVRHSVLRLAWRVFSGFDVPSGKFTRDCPFMVRVHDGLTADRWAIRDDLAIMAQLGAVKAARPDEVIHGTVTSHTRGP